MQLSTQWNKRLELRAEANKLYAEGERLRAESDERYTDERYTDERYTDDDECRAEADRRYTGAAMLWAETDLLRAEAAMLWTKGNKLRAEANLLWAEAVMEAYGNVKFEWKWRGDVLDYHLANGEIYRGDALDCEAECPLEGE